MNNSPRLWLRAETKTGEARTALSPETAATLKAAGFHITVETSEQRAVGDSAFANAGCELVEPGDWKQAPPDSYILGLKELPEDGTPLIHRHIFFAHAFKKQQGWKQILTRFHSGGGQLLDLEYLLDDGDRRIAAFGFWAGFGGTALAIMTWCGQQLGLSPPLANIRSWSNKAMLIDDVRVLFARATAHATGRPRLILIGAAGRVGSGAVAFARALELDVTPWDIEETRRGGPFEEILDHDIFVNCVLVNRPLPPFINADQIVVPERRLSVIADVSCDPFGDYNPIPLYTECTDFKTPLIRLQPDPKPLDLIAIDNLPSMLPLESSLDFSEQLLPALLQLGNPEAPIWQRAASVFQHHCSLIEDL